LHDAFVLFDVNHDGRITEFELNSVLSFLGIKASASDVKRMIADADIDGEFSTNLRCIATLFCIKCDLRKERPVLNCITTANSGATMHSFMPLITAMVSAQADLLCDIHPPSILSLPTWFFSVRAGNPAHELVTLSMEDRWPLFTDLSIVVVYPTISTL
uniref:EF-hand domain-containing protein n=1 Tax=Echinococcus canadensis TaxID=519352 RepID=A0A915EUT9_9CEST